MNATPNAVTLDRLVGRIKDCRVCLERPHGEPLPHAPRPVLRANVKARIGIFGQAPGLRVHKSGVPFSDPSGDRLRKWMGVTPSTFYNEQRIAIIPMGFCFPGYNAQGADLPPRRECAETWRQEILSHLTKLDLVLLVGSYAVRWHLKGLANGSLTDTVSQWRYIVEQTEADPQYVLSFPLPHPSWRNNGWIKANPWFEEELLPELRARVSASLERR